MIDAQELPVPGSLPLCIRVLLHWNTDLPQSEIKHIYLGEAASLRPDLTRTPWGLHMLIIMHVDASNEEIDHVVKPGRMRRSHGAPVARRGTHRHRRGR